MHPENPVWIDSANHRLILVGAVCSAAGPLELLACRRETKEYESVLTVGVEPHVVQAGLIALGVESGRPASRGAKFVPPQGRIIDVTLVWTDKQGRRRTAKAQDWIRRQGSAEAMAEPWVFTGGRFLRDEETGRQAFSADLTGNLICVSNFPDSVLDVPARSPESDPELLYNAFTERIPPRGTPVTLLLTPAIGPVGKTPSEGPIRR